MPIAMDFGTCNTVFARWNVAANRVELVGIGGLSRRFPYRLPGDRADRTAHVVPTLIHYGEGGTRLLGQQVDAEGLLDHHGTFRWVKLDLLRGNDRARRANGLLLRPREAATAFVADCLVYALGALGTAEDEELVVTVPVEAYDHYVDWLRDSVEAVAGTRRVRILDEATACILGHQETARDNDIYLIFDFGGGTLDVSIVKVNLGAEGLQKCLILGRAGEELGGMLVDQWMLARMKEAEGLTDADIREVGTPLMRGIEEAKIALSGGAPRADVTQLNDLTAALVSHTFTAGELQGILEQREFLKMVTRTLDRALDSAAGKYGTRKSAIRKVFMVGGTSLLLGVRQHVANYFPNTPVELLEPFAAIAAGACRYAGQDFDPTLVHDYQLEIWDPDRKAFRHVTIIPKGTQYPTDGAIWSNYICAGCDHATELNLVVYELSHQVRPSVTFVQGPDGRMQEVRGDGAVVERRKPLNPEARDFLRPDPPCDRDEVKRFSVKFGVDENKRLTIFVEDTRPGNRSKVKASDGRLIPMPIRDYPLVRL